MKVASQVFALILRHCRLTISPACADMTLLIRRVAHLAQRAPQKASLDARTLEHTASLLILVGGHG